MIRVSQFNFFRIGHLDGPGKREVWRMYPFVLSFVLPWLLSLLLIAPVRAADHVPIPADQPGWPPLSHLERQSPGWLTKAIFYQVYPQSYYDSNGNGIGDLRGIISKLDYIKSIGVNAIWLNPIYDSPFGDAGYDVRDYELVAPRYGTNDDARHLFAEAHKRGLHVLLDLVAGHTSIEHAWFKDSSSSASSKHANWYIWPTDGSGVKNPGARPGKYLPNYFAFQPALNYGYGKIDPAKPWQQPPTAPDCMAVRNAMRGVMKFWLDMGCDGFRVDMAASLIKNDDGKALKALWSDYRGWLERNYPQAILVSEWSDPEAAIPSGFDIDFIIQFGNPAYQCLLNPIRDGDTHKMCFFSRGGVGDIKAFLDAYLPAYEKTHSLGYISLPTGNHDFSRPRFQGREIPDLKVIYAMLLTMPGVPFIYYGDEIGMRNLQGWPSKEGAKWRGFCRSPMQWEPGDHAGFSTADPKQFYLPLDPDPNRPNVATEEKDPDSILNFTRALLKLRAENASLGNLGGFQPLYAEKNKYPFVYLRSGGPDNFIIAVNPSNLAQTCTVPALKNAVPFLINGSQVSDTTLSMTPISYAIYKAADLRP